MQYAIVEKANPRACHGVYETAERAVYALNNTIPAYVARGYFSDKTLTADDFAVVEWLPYSKR